jgi:predicted cobalt transporter CbtA
MTPEGYIDAAVVERFFNRVNVLRGIGFAVLCAAIAAAAISSGGWQGWLIGAVFLVLALYGLVGPSLWPKYRPPEA